MCRFNSAYYIVRIFVIINLFFLSLNFASANEPRIDIHTVEPKDTIRSVAYSYISKNFPEKLENVEAYINELIYWNPHVANWNQLPDGLNIYLGYPFPSNMEERVSFSSRFTLSASYNISSGSLTENIKTSATTVESSQNSMLSLSLQAKYNISNWEKVISSSIYYSQLQVTSVNGGTNIQPIILKFPPEIGGNTYYNFYLKKLTILPFWGIDYESLNTFNSNSLLSGIPLSVRKNKFIYGTFGLGQGFNFSTFVFLLRGSVSRIFYSTTSSTSDSDKYTGYKGIVSLNLKANKSPWLFNLFYKVHLLEGPTELVINRIGIGIGFSFF